MNISRIEVPITLPEPHFDDESTVVSARRVVPLNSARMRDRWRKLLTSLPILLAAMACGAFGAMAVNYLERRAAAPTIVSAPSTNPTQAEAASAQSSPVASASSSGDGAAGEVETDSSEGSDKSASESATVPAPEKTSEARTVPAKADEADLKKKPAQPAPRPDPRQMDRQRRVQPPAAPRPSQNDESKTGGAGRIQDIFSGPNP